MNSLIKKSTFIAVLIAVCGGLIFVGCSHFAPPVEGVRKSTSNAENEENSKCEKRALIDNINDGDDQILLRQGRAGYIYSYVDSKGSTVSPSTKEFIVSKGGVGETGFAMRMKGSLVDEEDVYAGMGFSLKEPMGSYDASKYTGISFIAKKGSDSLSAIRFKIPDINTEPEAGICKECYNDFGIGFKLTEEWTRYVVDFADLKQEQGWGDPNPQSLDAKAIMGLQWQVATRGAKYDVWIDDISFIGCP